MKRVMKFVAMGLGAIVALGFCALGLGYWIVSNPASSGPLQLPTQLVALDSERGQTLFAHSSSVDYTALAKSFQVQEKGTWCGVASAVTVLNARGATLSQEAFFTDGVTDVRPWFATTFGGMSLAELAAMVRAHGANASVHFASDANVEEFRAALTKNLATANDWLVVNFDRHLVGEVGGGHISPVSAYSKDADMVLILDTAGYKYPFHWIPVNALFDAMSTTDSASGKSRGWVEIR